MRKLERIARSNKYLLLSVLMLIGAIIFVVINQVDYLSKFSTAIVALALLVPSIILAGLGFYQTATVPLRWASMATVVVSAVVLIFVASSLITSLSNDGARDENGIAKEADALAPARAEAEGKKDQEGATETSTPTKAQSQAEVSMPVLFRNVNIFDGVNEELAMGMNVLVVDNLISQISAEELVVAANTLIIEGEGRTLIPGLHDQHVHFSMFNPSSDGERQNMTPFHVGAVAAARAERILLNGFTTVRDMGGPSKYLQRVVDAGVVPGPRIFPSENYITQTSGHADLRKLNDRHPELSGQGPDHWFETDVSFIADGPDAIRMAVRENLRRGATQIKIMGSGGVTSEFDPLHSVQYQPEEIQMAVKTAAQWETYVAAHVFTEKAIFNVIDNGVQVLEHIPFLTEEAAEKMVDKQIMFATAASPVFSVSEEQAEAFYTPSSFKKWKAVRAAAENLLNIIKTEPGMMDLFTLGTDLVNQWELTLEQDKKMNEEFIWLDRAGFTAFDILRVATSNGARMNELTGPNHPYQEGPLGVIEEGAYADVLLVDGNPLQDILLLADPDKNLKIIMKDGVIYKNTLK